MKLSIIVPAYNEEKRIGPTLEGYARHFTARFGQDVELIVVINGTRDRTEEVAKGIAAKYPQIRILVEPKPIGKGGAIVMGFMAATGELVGFVDADNATLPDAYQDLVDKIGDAGAIIASRWLKASVVNPRQPASRLVASRIFNTMVRSMFKLKITDTQCGAKLMKSDAVKAVLPHLGITRWAFDVDLLFQLRRAGYKIVEVPTVWSDASGSKLHVVETSFEMLIAIWRLRLIYSPLHWIVTVYDHTLGKLIHLKA